MQLSVLDLEASEIPSESCGGWRAEGARWVLVTAGEVPLGTFEAGPGEFASQAVLAEACQLRFGGVAHPAPPRLAEGPAPLASVVIPTNLKRPDGLRQTVGLLLAMDYPAFEVIVVDNRLASEPFGDAVLNELELLEHVRVVAERRPGIAAARNRGIAVAAGEILAFTDDDAQPDAGWLRALVARFQAEPAVDAISGLVLPSELDTSAQVLFEHSGVFQERSFHPLTFRIEEASRAWSPKRFVVTQSDQLDGTIKRFSLFRTGAFGMGCNTAFRTAVVRALRFDESLGTGTASCGGEDIELLLRALEAGCYTAFEPRALVRHSHRATFEELERQMHGYGVGLTAMLTALVVRDPRHLFGLAALVPQACWSIVRTGSPKGGADVTYPASLRRAERRGMLEGPLAYRRTRRRQSRWRPGGQAAGATGASRLAAPKAAAT